jgi:hypothetical protein
MMNSAPWLFGRPRRAVHHRAGRLALARQPGNHRAEPMVAVSPDRSWRRHARQRRRPVPSVSEESASAVRAVDLRAYPDWHRGRLPDRRDHPLAPAYYCCGRGHTGRGVAPPAPLTRRPPSAATLRSGKHETLNGDGESLTISPGLSTGQALGKGRSQPLTALPFPRAEASLPLW